MRYLCLLLLLPWTIGCSLIYDHNVKGHGFIIHSNQDAKFVKMAATQISQIRQAYQQLFNLSSEELGTLTFYLKGTSTDDSQKADLLGYYVPFFEHIVIDTSIKRIREEPQLAVVLLHEISHHFIITDCPEANTRPWLNEGLAGVLETTLFQGWHFEYMLFNPVLFDWVRKPENNVVPDDFKQALIANWSAFHNTERKIRNYAVSWSMCWYLLVHYLDQNLSLSERIKILYALEPDDIAKLAEGWHKFVMEFNENKYLVDLVRSKGHDTRLRRLYALIVLQEKLKNASLGGSEQPIQ